ncbi:peptidase [Caudoviricetes sp.]|jgi:GTP:adenosylcobinamide-phosphate guanylyltransferase|nr:peptidase [Caudoviricetes sp.]
MDPFTVLATAKAAVEGIKQAIAIGKDVHALVKDMSTLMSAEADLAKMAADPPKGWGVQGSAEEIALQAVTARKQVQALKQQVQNELVAQYGLTIIDELNREIIDVRKKQKAAAIKAAKEREEFVRTMMWVVPAIGIPMIILIVIIIVIVKAS